MMQIKNRDWYKCFKDELFKQPGVTADMDVREAAEHVAKTNDFIAYQLGAIKICEDYNMGSDEGFFAHNSELVHVTRMDLVIQDYIARYVSLKDKQFAKAAGKLPRRMLPGARMRWL
jgi:hypothetical protein